MILNNFSFVEENIVLFFKNESRSEVCLLRVYDYDHQVLVSRRDIRIAADGKAAFPISYLTGDNFHDGVKYVLNVQEHHEINCEKVYRLNSAYDLYIYVADNNKITFEIKSISPHCELVGILETKCDVSLQFSRLSGAKATKLLLKRRVSNKFWQYHDREFSFDLNGPSITIEKQILGEFFLTRPDSLWDFFIRNEFSDGSFFDSYVYHKDCDLAFSNIRIYVGNGKTLILRNAFASQVKNFELGRSQNLGFRSCRRRRKTVDLLVAQANPGHSRG